MTTPEKYRDRIFAAVVHYEARQKRTPRQRQDAYEDLMEVIDQVIEELGYPVPAPAGDPHAQ